MCLEERSASTRCFGMSVPRETQSGAALRRRSANGGLQLKPWLRRWLVESGYATVERDGSMQPTPLGAEIGRAVAAALD
jgi:hypothetical protein